MRCQPYADRFSLYHICPALVHPRPKRSSNSKSNTGKGFRGSRLRKALNVVSKGFI
jgi:hypothetical protein